MCSVHEKRAMLREYDLHSADSEERPMARYCVHDSEAASFIQGAEIAS
jgi:hypothetical protein